MFTCQNLNFLAKAGLQMILLQVKIADYHNVSRWP